MRDAYRLVARDVKHTETGEIGVLYEHLWPHNHGFWFRPQEMPAPYQTHRIWQFLKDMAWLLNPRSWHRWQHESFGSGFFGKNEKGEIRFALAKKM